MVDEVDNAPFGQHKASCIETSNVHLSLNTKIQSQYFIHYLLSHTLF